MKRKKIIITAVILVIVVAGGVFVLAKYKKVFSIIGPGGGVAPTETAKSKLSSLAGLNCENANARPIAIMMSSDQETRPLSGLGQADMVFEMPVVPNGMTRMMAVFQCVKPVEIGSVRSSRLDFVPLALGVKAIYGHFGGEHTVLEELNSGVINNIDGLKYDGTIYYRKKNIRPPHNAFTSYNLITEAATTNNYTLADSFAGYLHESKSQSADTQQPYPIYPVGFRVFWTYSKDTNSYFRVRAGKPEMDKNTGKQVESKNVIYMETTWSPISKDYIRVKTVGSGVAKIFKDGQLITGTWQKDSDSSKLYFYDENKKEVKFAPGPIWVQVVTTN